MFKTPGSVPWLSLATVCVYTTNIHQQGLYLSTQLCLQGVLVPTVATINDADQLHDFMEERSTHDDV